MSLDRVPLPVFPGLLAAFSDRAAILPPTSGTVVGFSVFVTDPPTGGPLTVELANASGGGGTRQALTLADGEVSGRIAADITLDGAQTLYLNVTAVNGTPMNLSGVVELETTETGSVYTQLTTLERVKAELGKAGTDDDALLADLINGVSSAFIGAVGRPIVATVHAAEKISGDGFTDTLLLGAFPVTTFTELRDSEGSVIDAASYDVNPETGQVFAASGSWAYGRRNFEADYESGWATVPARIVSAVTAQVCHEFAQTQPGGGRRGVSAAATATGESETYAEGALLPIFEDTIEAYRDLF